jgi:hypothetical protein
MGFFDEPMRAETADARQAILQLLRNRHPGHEISTELMEVADRYLRLNPDDSEVRSARNLLTVPSPGA